MSIKSRFTAVLSAITGNTEPAPKAPRKGEQTAQLAKARGTIGEHPSKGLTPQKLHQILEGAEGGDITAQSELFAAESGYSEEEAEKIHEKIKKGA